MAERTRTEPQGHEKDLVLTRDFDAPRELVWKVWTEPEHLAQWWGPKYFTNPRCEVDLRPGGTMRIDMADPDGNVYPMKAVFHEIVEPERLVFTSRAIEDDEGNPLLETLNTVTFAEHEGKTRITMEANVLVATPEAADALEGMEEGWIQTLDKLAEYLESA